MRSSGEYRGGNDPTSECLDHEREMSPTSTGEWQDCRQDLL